MKEKKEKSNHYVDNKQFFVAMSEWIQRVKDAENTGEPKPPVTDYIGECFMKIAEHLSYRQNFINYSYREEMVGDGIENCLMYAHNFDPEKSKNPFSYFTQMIYYAFLRRIEKEKKQLYVKYKMIEEQDTNNLFPRWVEQNFEYDEKNKPKNIGASYLGLNETDLEKFKPKKRKKTDGVTLDNFIEDANENSTDK